MAWKFTIEATCDKCGKSIVPPNLITRDLTTLESVKTLRWCMQRQWKREGVMQGLPNLVGKRKMWCKECAGN